MAEDLERLKRKRTVLRSLTTRLLNRVEREIEDNEPGVDVLEDVLDQLANKRLLLEEVDKQIELATRDLDELETEIMNAQEYIERIIEAKGGLERKLRETRHAKPQGRNDMEKTRTAVVKLPRLTLDKYYGDVSAWQGFWSQFEAAVHKNESLELVDKFNYLKSYVGGTAANAISGLSLSASNYESAIKILMDRFGRKDLVVSAHMNKLLSLTPVRSSSDITSLRRLYDECEVHISSLRALGVISSQYGSLLCPILLKVIPFDITLEFSRRREVDNEWDASELLDLLRREVEGRERANILGKQERVNQVPNMNLTSSWKQKRKSEYEGQYVRKDQHTSAALSTVINQCFFCKGTNHKSEDCTAISIADKKEELRKQGRCFKCLKQKHIARHCKANILCTNCGGRHNKAVCNRAIDKIQKEPSQRNDGSLITAVSQFGESRGTVLLQTVNANIGYSNGYMVVQCLMDGGSQRSFIREEISKRLKLPVVGEETLNIYTFGIDTAVKTTMRRVKLSLKNACHPERSIDIEALETSTISGAVVQIPEAPLIETLKTRGLCLANRTFKEDSNNISILIGADYYWRIATGKTERLNSNLMALDTILGWTVHGPTSTSSLSLRTESIQMAKVISKEFIEEEALAERLKSFGELDAIEIADVGSSTVKEEANSMFE